MTLNQILGDIMTNDAYRDDDEKEEKNKEKKDEKKKSVVTPRVFKILKPDMSSYALQSIWHLVKTLRCIQ